jgi:hypothetical protein
MVTNRLLQFKGTENNDIALEGAFFMVTAVKTTNRTCSSITSKLESRIICALLSA